MTSANGYSDKARLFIRIAVFVIALILTVDAVWLPFSTITLYDNIGYDALKVGTVLTGTWLAATLIEKRLQNDADNRAKLLKNAAFASRTLVLALALLTALVAAITVFTYLASTAALPFVDPCLARIDAAVGFDWPAFVALVNSSRWLSSALSIAYFSMAPQMAFVVIFLALSRNAERLMEFLALLAVTALATCVIMALWPAEGALAYHHPPDQILRNFSAGAGTRHLEILLELRKQQPFTMNSTEGLVTFPSFHAVVGILLSYSLRRMRYLTLPVWILNAGLIVGTLPEGAHYLTDVAAGAAIALAAIASLRIAVRGWAASHDRVAEPPGPKP